jgi:L-ribulose-5-phosphate 4-epimerase
MLEKLKQEALAANLQLKRDGLIHLTFGNASALDRARGIFAIKPSGVPYEDLKVKDMVLVDLDGKRVEGELNPSSDTPTHRRLYIDFPQIGGIVHTHSLNATAFAQAGKPIPALGTTHADTFFGEIPVTRKLTASEIAEDYEWNTGGVIVERFKELNPLELPGVLVNRHAPFTWGATVAEAVESALVVELCARMAILSLQLAPTLKEIEPKLLDRHFHRKHGPKSTYGQKSGS